MGRGGSLVDAEAIRRKVAALARNGLASPDLIRHAKPGAVFLAKDAAIAFPEERLPDGQRTLHRARWVIICNDPTLCRATSPKSILVVPCTASAAGALGHWHYEVPLTEAAFTGDRVVALPHLIQPILRSELVKFMGDLSPQVLAALMARVAQNIGLLPGLLAPKPEEAAAAVADSGKSERTDP